MPKRKAFSVLRYAKESMVFLRKQPALWWVTLLLIALPSWLSSLLARQMEQGSPMIDTGIPEFLQQNDPMGYSLVVVSFVLFLCTIWGIAGVIVVGQRMIGNRAGRSRTSASSVLKESTPFVFPIFFTAVIQTAHAMLWMLIPLVAGLIGLYFCLLPLEHISTRNIVQHCWWLLLVLPLVLPTIVYFIRSGFYAIALVSEDFRYAAALRRSKEIVNGYFWITLRCLILLVILFIVPGAILIELLEPLTQTSVTNILLIDAFTNIVTSFLLVPMILSVILLYGQLRDAPRSVEI